MSPTTSDTSSTTSNGSGLARNGSTSAFRAALGAKFGTAAVAGGGGSPGQDGTMTPVPLTPLPYELVSLFLSLRVFPRLTGFSRRADT